MNVCPKSAIEMVPDGTGLNYPVINERCVECGACRDACSRRLIGHGKNFIQSLYAGRSKNEDLRYESTSGGVFSELASYVLKNNGCVAGARYNSDNVVEHVIISTEDDLRYIRQSKYVQSNTNYIYRLSKEVLLKGKVLLFCGTPCQVAALKAFLDWKEYDNLITVDFICRGVNSPKAFMAWLKEIEHDNNNKIVRVWFKNKKNGWKASPKCTRIDFEDGTHREYDGNDNLFMCSYLDHNMIIRRSCECCDFKGVKKDSDVTLADYWGLDKDFEDNKGTSMVFVNSKKGENIISKISDKVLLIPQNIIGMSTKNPALLSSIKLSEYNDEFLSQLDNMPYSRAYHLYTQKNNVSRFSVPTPKNLIIFIRNRVKKEMSRWLYHFRGVKYTNNGLLFRGRNTCISFGKNCTLDIGQALKLNDNLPRHSKRSTLLRMDDDSVFTVKGSASIYYGADIILFRGAKFQIGDSFINSNCKIRCHENIVIGDNCAISHDFTVMDSDAHEINGSRGTKEVIIGDHVLIGTRVTILSGVHVGDGAVIGAGAVVKDDVPAYSMVAGIPARVKKVCVEWK